MTYYHCRVCDHEWESLTQLPCDWCGGESFILEGEIPPDNSFSEHIGRIRTDELENGFTKNVIMKIQESIPKE